MSLSSLCESRYLSECIGVLRYRGRSFGVGGYYCMCITVNCCQYSQLKVMGVVGCCQVLDLSQGAAEWCHICCTAAHLSEVYVCVWGGGDRHERKHVENH